MMFCPVVYEWASSLRVSVDTCTCYGRYFLFTFYNKASKKRAREKSVCSVHMGSAIAGAEVQPFYYLSLFFSCTIYIQCQKICVCVYEYITVGHACNSGGHLTHIIGVFSMLCNETLCVFNGISRFLSLSLSLSVFFSSGSVPHQGENLWSMPYVGFQYSASCTFAQL